MLNRLYLPHLSPPSIFPSTLSLSLALYTTAAYRTISKTLQDRAAIAKDGRRDIDVADSVYRRIWNERRADVIEAEPRFATLQKQRAHVYVSPIEFRFADKPREIVRCVRHTWKEIRQALPRSFSAAGRAVIIPNSLVFSVLFIFIGPRR